MVVFPNCKVNIGLDVLRRRPDKYHDLATVMIPVPWCDVLEVVPAKGEATTLTVTGRGVDCPMEKNLVYKAYVALCNYMKEHFGKEVPSVDIYLEKIIPDGAGLGGGSSDAAFTIKAVNDLFQLGLTKEQMAQVAAKIGADCPFFIYNRPCLAMGIGEILTPIDLPLEGLDIVIVKPPLGVSTAEAYGKIVPFEPEITLEERLTKPISWWQRGSEEDVRFSINNAFETTVFAIYPQVQQIKEQLLELSGVRYCAMSGSGSAVFALAERGSVSQATLKELFPDYILFIGHLNITEYNHQSKIYQSKHNRENTSAIEACPTNCWSYQGVIKHWTPNLYNFRKKEPTEESLFI